MIASLRLKIASLEGKINTPHRELAESRGELGPDAAQGSRCGPGRIDDSGGKGQGRDERRGCSSRQDGCLHVPGGH